MIYLLACDISKNKPTNNFWRYSVKSRTMLPVMNQIGITWQHHNWHSRLPEWAVSCILSEYVNKPSERRQKLYTLKSVSGISALCSPILVVFPQYVCLLKIWRFVKWMKEPSVPKLKVDKLSIYIKQNTKINVRFVRYLT